MEDGFVEKRKFIRLEIQRMGKCGLLADEPTNCPKVTVEIQDLSPGGACILGDEAAVAGIISAGLVKLEIPFGDDMIVVQGIVAWTRKWEQCFRVGLNFKELSEEESKKLRLYLYERGIRSAFTFGHISSN